jgi:hypothetical protein
VERNLRKGAGRIGDTGTYLLPRPGKENMLTKLKIKFLKWQIRWFAKGYHLSLNPIRKKSEQRAAREFYAREEEREEN